MNVVELETNVLLTYAAFLIFLFLLMVVLSSWQRWQNLKLKRELENRRIKRIIEMAEQREVIEAIILRNKLTGELDTQRMAKQIVKELNTKKVTNEICN